MSNNNPATSYLNNDKKYQGALRAKRYNAATEVLDAIAATDPNDKETLIKLYAELAEING